ncbi:MAG: hypothetical protein AAB308_10995 [Nitrospirota bacterium]
MGESPRKAVAGPNGAIALDTFGGRIHVEWDPAAAVTPLGQLPVFIEFLKVSGLFETWVADCPLTYHSNHASDKRAVLATTATHISRRFAMTGFTPSCWACQGLCRRMPHGGRSPASTNRQAWPGSTGIWRRRRSRC